MAYSAGPDPSSTYKAPGRIFHHYADCEEFHDGGGMWRNVSGTLVREHLIESAAELMRRSDRFLAAMLRATREWPNSCESNLTAEGTNQRAWLGHAGCYLATGSVEECTRLGWHRLSAAQQIIANGQADEAIATWRKRRPRKPITSSDQLSIFGGSDA